MTREKQGLLWTGVAIVFLAGLIPPWCQYGPNNFAQSCNYALIFLPPTGCVVDIYRLLIEWSLVGIVFTCWIRIGPPSNRMLLSVSAFFLACIAIQQIGIWASSYHSTDPFAGLSSSPHTSQAKDADPFANMPPVQFRSINSERNNPFARLPSIKR